MKKIFIATAALLVMAACKKEGDNTTKVTTEEITQVDTVGNQEQKTTVVKRTVETDTSETTISTGGVEVTPVEGSKAE